MNKEREMEKQKCQINGCDRSAEGHRIKSVQIDMVGEKWAEIDVCVEHYISAHTTRQIPLKKED